LPGAIRVSRQIHIIKHANRLLKIINIRRDGEGILIIGISPENKAGKTFIKRFTCLFELK
jgi:hypothetical protein